jgi:hypothetical protein
MSTVRIVNDDGISQGTKFVDAETGAEIHGVRAAVVRFAIDEMVHADLDLGPIEIHTIAQAKIRMTDPGSGETKEVARIVFMDGTEWPAVPGARDRTSLADDKRVVR